MKTRLEHIGRIVSVVAMVAFAVAFVVSFIGIVIGFLVVMNGGHLNPPLAYASGVFTGAIMALVFAYTKKAVE